MKCIRTLEIFSILTVLIFTVSPAFAENIDPANDGSQYAYGGNVGWLNFEPSEGDGVHVNKTQLTGYVWAENIGWLNFQSVDLYGYNFKACKVNFEGLANFVDDWLKSDIGLLGDLSGNDEVDSVDYSIFASYWLDYCPLDWSLK